MIMEIHKLAEMLNQANIPFEITKRFGGFELPVDGLFADYGYQIGYPQLPQTGDFVCSVIEEFGTYGFEENKLEIMGLLTDEESKFDDVVGHLTAEDVFQRIKNHYEREDKNESI